MKTLYCYLERAENASAGVFAVDDVRTGVVVDLTKSTSKRIHVPQHLNTVCQQPVVIYDLHQLFNSYIRLHHATAIKLSLKNWQ